MSDKKIKEIVSYALKQQGFKGGAEILVCFTGDGAMRKLNRLYLGQDSPTDVLAFDFSRGKENIHADIVISTETCVTNSRVFKTSLDYEAYLYIAHGILHILGYNDFTLGQRKRMNAMSANLLERLGIQQ
ncbi:MAG: rRNA maturation RNase YbeY [Candidatus Omnitrophota bacterium]|nr:rRNA maturation RNase YbeY [Candidatus Omnitrophota bacterium]